jgi:NAD(P)-dependent dehydrogenase (short-subunit alcohol dehydrogenase family)
MATFVYEAMREPGEVIKGELDAEDATAAASSLVGRGYHVIRVSDANALAGRRGRLRLGIWGGLKRRDMVRFTRDMSSLLGAVLPLSQALVTLRNRAGKSGWRAVFGGLRARLEDGQTFSQALAVSDALRFEVKGFGIDVVVIEPGLIVTEFGETAAGSLDEVDEHGPYAKFNADVAKLTAGAYKGGMARFGGGPDAVAAKIAKALLTRRPATRYKVTPSARVVMGMRGLMTDRMWDRFVRTQYPPPKPEA